MRLEIRFVSRIATPHLAQFAAEPCYKQISCLHVSYRVQSRKYLRCRYHVWYRDEIDVDIDICLAILRTRFHTHTLYLNPSLVRIRRRSNLSTTTSKMALQYLNAKFSVFPRLFQPIYDAIFSTLPFSHRWRLLLLQPLNILIPLLTAPHWLFNNRYSVMYIPTRSGPKRALVFRPPRYPLPGLRKPNTQLNDETVQAAGSTRLKPPAHRYPRRSVHRWVP